MLEKFISSLFVAEFTDICKFGCFTLVKQGYRIKVITIRLVCKYNNTLILLFMVQELFDMKHQTIWYNIGKLIFQLEYPKN